MRNQAIRKPATIEAALHPPQQKPVNSFSVSHLCSNASLSHSWEHKAFTSSLFPPWFCWPCGISGADRAMGAPITLQATHTSLFPLTVSTKEGPGVTLLGQGWVIHALSTKSTVPLETSRNDDRSNLPSNVSELKDAEDQYPVYSVKRSAEISTQRKQPNLVCLPRGWQLGYISCS